jgi:hypothetical protein
VFFSLLVGHHREKQAPRGPVRIVGTTGQRYDNIVSHGNLLFLYLNHEWTRTHAVRHSHSRKNPVIPVFVPFVFFVIDLFADIRFFWLRSHLLFADLKPGFSLRIMASPFRVIGLHGCDPESLSNE